MSMPNPPPLSLVLTPTSNTPIPAEDSCIFPVGHEEHPLWAQIENELQKRYKKQLVALCYLHEPAHVPPTSDILQLDGNDPKLTRFSDQEGLDTMMRVWNDGFSERIREQLVEVEKKCAASLDGGTEEQQIKATAELQRMLTDKSRHSLISNDLLIQVLSKITTTAISAVALGCIRICWMFCQSNEAITAKLVDMGLVDSLLGMVSDGVGRLVAPSSPAVLASLCVLLSLSTSIQQYHTALFTEKPLRILVSLAQGYRHSISMPAEIPVEEAQKEKLQCVEIALFIISNCINQHNQKLIRSTLAKVPSMLVKRAHRITEKLVARTLSTAPEPPSSSIETLQRSLESTERQGAEESPPEESPPEESPPEGEVEGRDGIEISLTDEVRGAIEPMSFIQIIVFFLQQFGQRAHQKKAKHDEAKRRREQLNSTKSSEADEEQGERNESERHMESTVEDQEVLTSQRTIWKLSTSLLYWVTHTRDVAISDVVSVDDAATLLRCIHSSVVASATASREIKHLPTNSFSRPAESRLYSWSVSLHQMIHRMLVILWELHIFWNRAGLSKTLMPLTFTDVRVLLRLANRQHSGKRALAICAAGILENAAQEPQNCNSFLGKPSVSEIQAKQVSMALIHLMNTKAANVRVSAASVAVGLVQNASAKQKDTLIQNIYEKIMKMMGEKASQPNVQLRLAYVALKLTEERTQDGGLYITTELNQLKQLVNVIRTCRHDGVLPFVVHAIWMLAREEPNRQPFIHLGAIQAIKQWVGQSDPRHAKHLLAPIWLLSYEPAGAELIAADKDLLANIVKLAQHDHRKYPALVHIALSLLWNTSSKADELKEYNKLQENPHQDDKDQGVEADAEETSLRLMCGAELWVQLVKICHDENALGTLQLVAAQFLQYCIFGDELAGGPTLEDRHRDNHIKCLVNGLLALLLKGERLLKKASKQHNTPWGHADSIFVGPPTVPGPGTVGREGLACLMYATTALSVLSSSPKRRPLIMEAEAGKDFLARGGSIVPALSVRIAQTKQNGESLWKMQYMERRIKRESVTNLWDTELCDDSVASALATAAAAGAFATSFAFEMVAVANAATLLRPSGTLMTSTLLSICERAAHGRTGKVVANSSDDMSYECASFPTWAVLDRALHLLLNLSGKPDCQALIGRHSEAVPLFMELAHKEHMHACETRVLAGGILANLSQTASNRSRLYKCELRRAVRVKTAPLPQIPPNAVPRQSKESGLRAANPPSPPPTFRRAHAKGTLQLSIMQSLVGVHRQKLHTQMDTVTGFDGKEAVSIEHHEAVDTNHWKPTILKVTAMDDRVPKIPLSPKKPDFVNTKVVQGSIRRAFKFRDGGPEMSTAGDPNTVWQPVLCKFPRVKGSKVHDGILPRYVEPDGTGTYYYRAGGSLEKAAFMGHFPPGEPLSYPSIWLLGLPTAPISPAVQMIDSLRPASAEQENRLKPPVPDTDLDLKDSPFMYLGFIAEDWPVRAPTPQPFPWILEQHSRVWKRRKKNSAGRGCYDNCHSRGKLMRRCLRKDLERMCSKPTGQRLIKKYLEPGQRKGSLRNLQVTDKEKAQMVTDVEAGIFPNYQVISDAFRYYASSGSKDPFGIGTNAYALMLTDVPVENEDYKCVKSGTLDTMFITCNIEEGIPGNKINTKHSTVRYEFVELVMRLAIAKYIEMPAEMRSVNVACDPKNVAATLSEAVDIFVKRDLLPMAPIPATTPSDVFRKERIYTEQVDDMLFSFLPYIDAIFERYSPKTRKKFEMNGARDSKHTDMDIPQWINFLQDLKLLNDDFTIKEAVFCFVTSKMHEPDEFNIAASQRLQNHDFVEVICRMACLISTPSDEEVAACAEVNDAEAPVFAYWEKCEMNESDESGHVYTMEPPLSLYGNTFVTPENCFTSGQVDSRCLLDRVPKLLMILFRKLRDGSLDGNGQLDTPKGPFLHRMEEGFQLAIGNRPRKETWRSLHEKKMKLAE